MTTFELGTLLTLNIVLLVLNVILFIMNNAFKKQVDKKLQDAEYKRWQVIHHHYVREEIREGKKELTMLHPFIREHGGCKGNKSVWDDSLFMTYRKK